MFNIRTRSLFPKHLLSRPTSLKEAVLPSVLEQKMPKSKCHEGVWTVPLLIPKTDGNAEYEEDSCGGST